MKKLSRREFLRLAGVGVTVATVSACAPGGVPGAQTTSDDVSAPAGEAVKLSWIISRPQWVVISCQKAILKYPVIKNQGAKNGPLHPQPIPKKSEAFDSG